MQTKDSGNVQPQRWYLDKIESVNTNIAYALQEPGKCEAQAPVAAAGGTQDCGWLVT